MYFYHIYKQRYQDFKKCEASQKQILHQQKNKTNFCTKLSKNTLNHSVEKKVSVTKKRWRILPYDKYILYKGWVIRASDFFYWIDGNGKNDVKKTFLFKVTSVQPSRFLDLSDN